MKTIKFILMLLMPCLGFGQSIINGNFESWSSTSYDQPGPWTNSNYQSLNNTGKASVFKTTDKHGGSYAVKITGTTNGTDTATSYIVTSDQDPLKGRGGFPYSSKPSKITGYYKYSPIGTDQALFIVVFKKAGLIIGLDSFRLGAASSYTYFEHSVSPLLAPDTVILAASSSATVLKGKGIPGSVLYLDDLAFTGTGTIAAIPDGDFETWSTASFDKAAGWNQVSGASSGGMMRTTDSYKGQYALELSTTQDHKPSIITNGNVNPNKGPTGGRPFSSQTDTLIGYYKYTSVGNDSGSLALIFTKNGSIIGSYGVELPAQSTYTQFKVPINLPTTPDSMQIDFFSNNYMVFNKAHTGSTLIIDELQLASAPLNTGISINEFRASYIKLFPNPASGSIKMQISGIAAPDARLDIYDALGNVIQQRILPANEYPNVDINLEGMKSGMYFYHVSAEGNTISGSFMKQ